jgi:[ribosomal protein S5]-alanine N-acetyltransferase
MGEIELRTKRTKLRLIELSDLAFIHQVHSLPETDQYNALGIPKDIEETKLVIKPWIEENLKEKITNYTFLIEENQSKNPIGLFGIKLGNKKYKRAEIWYKIHSDYWNKGYATETVNAIIAYCFDNIGSIKVLEKAGMIKEGRGRQILPLKSGWSDNFEYAILESDARIK